MAIRKNSQDHLRTKHYRAATDFAEGPSMLGRRLLDHLTEICSDCKRYWQQLGKLREVLLERVEELRLGRRPYPEPREWSVTTDDMKRQEEETKELRRRRRRCWEQKSELLGTDAEKRVGLIHRSKRRFNSQLLAEALFDDGREALRSTPKRAARLFSLIPEVLRVSGVDGGPEWAWGLVVRSKTWQANALRIAGDLKASRVCFQAANEDLEARPILDTWIAGERASMEASLAMEEMLLNDAETLLERAALLFSVTDDLEAQAKVMVQQANLESKRGCPAEALRLFERTALYLEESENLHLLGQAVTGRIKVLCDLDRMQEARELLVEHVDCFELEEVTQEGGIYYRILMGRISLAEENYLEAEECFSAVVEAFLTLDRAYDATLAALDLAETYLRAGKRQDLQALSGKLLKRLIAHGVSEKTAKAVALLRESIGRDQVTVALLASLRSKLKSHPAA